MRNLLNETKVVKSSNGATAGTSAVTGTSVDMTGYDAALIIADLGTVTDGSVLQLAAQNGAQSNGSDAAAISGANTPSVTASSSSNGQLVLDVINPGIGGNKQYLTPVLTRTTQNAVVNSITVILYRGRKLPPTQPSTVLASATAECAS